MGQQGNADYLISLIQAVLDAGYEPGVYSSYGSWEKVFGSADFVVDSLVPLWVSIQLTIPPQVIRAEILTNESSPTTMSSRTPPSSSPLADGTPLSPTNTLVQMTLPHQMVNLSSAFSKMTPLSTQNLHTLLLLHTLPLQPG